MYTDELVDGEVDRLDNEERVAYAVNVGVLLEAGYGVSMVVDDSC
jgi:hypothetical protein